MAAILERPGVDNLRVLIRSLELEARWLEEDIEWLEEAAVLEEERHHAVEEEEAKSAALYSLRATLEAVDSEGVQDCAAADARAAQPGSEMSGIGSNPAADPGQGSSISPPQPLVDVGFPIPIDAYWSRPNE